MIPDGNKSLDSLYMILYLFCQYNFLASLVQVYV